MHLVSSAKKVLRSSHLKFEQRRIFDAHVFDVAGNEGPENAARVPFIVDLVRLLKLLVVKCILCHLVEIIYVPDYDKFVVLALNLHIVTRENTFLGHLKCITNISVLAKNDTVKHICEQHGSLVHDSVILTDANYVFCSSLMEDATNFLRVA